MPLNRLGNLRIAGFVSVEMELHGRSLPANLPYRPRTTESQLKYVKEGVFNSLSRSAVIGQ